MKKTRELFEARFFHVCDLFFDLFDASLQRANSVAKYIYRGFLLRHCATEACSKRVGLRPPRLRLRKFRSTSTGS
jgi:hypothetical protein